MKTPWRSLAVLALALLATTSYKLYAGTSTFSATPGVGATLRETTDGSGFFLPNTTIWDSAAGANGLTINADHTMDVEGIVSNAGSAVATGSLNLGTIAYNYGFNGTTWDQLQVDASKFLKVNVAAATGTIGVTESGTWNNRVTGNAGGIFDFVGQNAAQPANSILVGGEFNTAPTTLTTGDASPLQLSSAGQLLVNCATGCSGGSASNASSGVATSSTNGTTDSWLYAFNGATWDQLQVDASKFLKVNVSAGTVAATESGTWTVNVKGNAGAAFDGVGYNGALPANEVLMGAEFLTSPGAITSGNISPLQMDSTGHLLVNCTGCSAASDVGGFHALLTQTPTVTASAYASGNDMGGLLTFAAFRNTTQTSGKIDNIMISFKGGSVATSYTLYVFAVTPGTTCTDKTAFALATADVSKLAAVAPIVMTPQVFGTGSVESFASVQPNITIANTGSVQNIFMCLVANGAVTPASTTDLVVTVASTQD